MIAVLLQIQRMPMLGVRNSKDEINNFALALLHGGNGGAWVWMELRRAHRARIRLWKDSRTIGECVTDWRSELPKNLPQSLLEFLIDQHMLINPEIRRW